MRPVHLLGIGGWGLVLLMLAPISKANPVPWEHRDALVEIVREAARRHNLPEWLLVAICDRESAWRWAAVGDDGESLGLCQVKRETVAMLLGRDQASLMPWDRDWTWPEANADLAARWLDKCRIRFLGRRGRIEKASKSAQMRVVGCYNGSLAYGRQVWLTWKLAEHNAARARKP